MQFPRNDFNDESVSSIEEMDPEPPGNRGFSYAREFLVGLALIIVVLSWGGTQWWRQQTLSTDYRAGKAAVAAKDWDTAHSRFVAAAGYLDSNTLAANASQMIEARNEAYRESLSAIKNSQWAPALQAANTVEAIQPGYRETHDLATVARDGVYDTALAGSVIARTGGDKPGLYYYGNGWTLLQGSDKWSRTGGIGVSGWVVYDVPTRDSSPGESPLFPSSPYLLVPGSPGLRGRALVAADISGPTPRYAYLTLDPSSFNVLLWGEKGVWGLRYKNNYLPVQSSLRLGFSAFDIAYEAFGSDAVSPVTLPGADWTIMDFSMVGDSILLARESASGDGGSAGLYMAQPDGTHARLVFSYSGALQRAQFSPDGRYILVLIHRPADDYRHEVQAVTLLDVSVKVPARTLLERITDSITGRIFPAMGAIFVPSGPYAGKILLADWGLNSSTLSLLDPGSPTTALATADGPSSPVGRVWVASNRRSNSVVVAWQNGLGGALPYADEMTAISFSPGTQPVTATIPLSTGEAVTGVWLSGDNMVFSEEPYSTGSNQAQSYSIRGVAIGTLGLPRITPETLLTRSAADRGVASGVEWHAGPGLFAYLEGDALHVRTYDGSTDLMLESGTAGFLDTSPDDIHSIR